MIPGQEQNHVPSLNLDSIRDCRQGDETMALPLEVVLANNLWVIICGLLVFIMTVSVGFLEVGELGADMDISLLKTMLITGSSIFFMAFVGFNPGSVLACNNSAMTVVLTTFLAAASSLLSIMYFRYRMIKKMPDLIYATNGVLMGLIIITPLAGFVSPGSAVILGLIGGPLFLAGEKWFSRFKWFSDPVGLFPGHLLGGLFGVTMIAFFSQRTFAIASGNPVTPGNSPIPDGLLFGG